MQNCWVQKCKFCGKLYKIYNMQVYQGDPSCCKECNLEADKETKPKPTWYEQEKRIRNTISGPGGPSVSIIY